MRPLNYAILKLFESGGIYDAEDVMLLLRDEYAKFRTFKKNNIVESLMSAEKNFLLEQSHFDLDDKGQLHIYYKATDLGHDLIGRFIK